ncbi:MAG: bifunctional 4-hydroxy-2-oxoglutarate aldolase/2-dehydro-3-deoxy-phosphogluconate aldolase [Eubacteriales bacterium]|nr:bifunctional 4-hydroxy-2-oxoglutarate aldolase/2-dehydro-3-deoxy-phosphogluconate aldolase [Eubacteriales bacterium]
MSNVMEKIGQMGLVPVVVIENEDDALDAAKAMMDGGLPIMEITLRTAAGIPSIRKIKQAYPEILLGAGTVLNVESAIQAVEAGAEFIVSPGFNDGLVKWCIDNGIAVTPGCVTPTEIEHAQSFGLNILKFFPANVYGGIDGCKALHGPYGMVRFIPTGGISTANLADYADKEFIHAAGGGWLCKTEYIKAGRFDAITKNVVESINILLGFELAHIGINQDTAENSLKVTKQFAEAFGFVPKEGSSSNFAGMGIEVNKEKGPGNMGHIAIRTNSIERAVYYLSEKGFAVDWSTRKGPQGKRPAAVYLKDEFGGFAIHLLQK